MKIFLFFFWNAIKIAGSVQKKKNRVGRVSGNIGLFFFFLGLRCICLENISTRYDLTFT